MAEPGCVGGWYFQGLPVREFGELENLIAKREVEEVVLATGAMGDGMLAEMQRTCEQSGVALQRFAVRWEQVRPSAFSEGSAA